MQSHAALPQPAAAQQGKLRIAMFVNSFPELSETFVINQVVGLLEQGHDVHIFSLHPAGRLHKSLHPDIERHRLVERTHYPLPRPKQRAALLPTACGLLARVISNYPRSLVVAGGFFTEGITGAWRLVCTANTLAQMPKYDLVHCQFGTVARAIAVLYDSGVLDAPLVTSFRGYDISRFVKLNGSRVYDRIFRQGSYFLTNCAYFERRLLRLGCRRERLEVLRSGIDCSKFPFHPRQLDPLRAVRIATVGRLVEKKGIEFGIRAVAALLQAGQRIEYKIVGDGVLRPQLEALIRDLNLQGCVTLLGARNQTDIVALLSESDLFLAPSVRAADGDEDAPVNVLKEAMAMGLPVIATDHGGIPELVQDGVSGFLVPERDPAAIAQRISQLIQRSDTWSRMAYAARAVVEQQYNNSDLNHRLGQVYAAAIANYRADNSLPSLPCQPNQSTSRSWSQS